MPTSLPEPTRTVTLPDGRDLALDDVGDPHGRVVVYVHGTPDSRLARHPDDTLAAALGIRLLAVDRPGFGASTPHAAATPASFGGDVAAALEVLGVHRCSVLAWSAGATWALGLLAELGSRASSGLLAGGLVPADAYDDPAVRAAAGEPRLAALEAAAELGAEGAAELIGPLLVPDPPTLELALEHLEAAHDAVTAAELDRVPGARDRMALALLDAVRQGTAGLVRDVTIQLAPLALDLARVTAPVAVVHGAQDPACPPAFGAWFARHLPDATLHVVDGGGHAVLLTHWQELLAQL